MFKSLGDAINPDRQINLYRDQIAFKSTFSIRICHPNPNHCDKIDSSGLKKIEKFEINGF